MPIIRTAITGGAVSSLLNRWLGGKADRLYAQFLRYVVVGGIAFAVDFTVLILLTELAGIHYLVSAGMAFCGGLLLNYALCIKWVFRSRTLQDTRAEFIVFSLVGVAGLGLTELILYAGTGRLGFDYRLSKIVAVATVLIWNFSARKLLLFRDGSR